MTILSLSDWQETLAGEMLLMKLLGRILYTYPENDERTWLQSLIDEDIFCEAPFAADQDETKAGLKFLKNWGKNGMSGELFRSLQADYTRLFIGPGKVLATPWESVYFGEDRLVFQEETLQVRAWYRRFGLEPEKLHHQPDDHIGLELLFLGHLARLGLQALQKEDQPAFEEYLLAQRQFLAEHPLKWAGSWCELVQEHARTDFYRGLAHLTEGAVLAAAEMLGTKMPEEAT